MKFFIKTASSFLLVFSTAQIAVSQTAFGDLDELNTITTAVPFLTIAPDSRSGAMGDVGAASAPDGNSIHWNPAKLAFLEEGTSGVSLSYTPWLSRLVPDIDLAYITYYSTLGKNQGIGASLRYFSLGSITFTDEEARELGTFNPNEFAIDIAYALRLFDNFSMGASLRYIYSNLTAGQNVSGLQSKPGQSVASDISCFYQGDQFRMEDLKARWAAGLNISNIGAKISYTESGDEDFIPTNLRVGGSLTIIIDKYNEFTLMGDVNKLLVPTPPKRDGNGVIIEGEDPDVGFFTGIFQSFSDAPGGTKEELRELVYSVGAEYWYDKKFAFRGGYLHEHETKGNRKYFTLGAGLKYTVFGLDFAYLIPATFDVKSPLENTLRFTLSFDFESFADQEE